MSVRLLTEILLSAAFPALSSSSLPEGCSPTHRLGGTLGLQAPLESVMSSSEPHNLDVSNRITSPYHLYTSQHTPPI